MRQVPIVIALGSNIGDSLTTLRLAISAIRGGVDVGCVSTFVRSAPMYLAEQPPFVNAVLVGNTELGPLALLAFLKSIELALGRRARERNGPRELDLDIVAYGSLRLHSEGLEIPHPRLAERRFVLQPLFEVAPETLLPGLRSVATMLAATEDQALNVQPISDAALSISSSG